MLFFFHVLIVYSVGINLLYFFFFGFYKFYAKKEKRRIPERTLLVLALIGGSIGAWAGMYFFHHKTKIATFVWGMPLIFILQVLFGVILLSKIV
jgi:uncharacterized membrane protein YsdA (DUF1294 family)